MRTKCISVRLQSMVRITDKAYKATAYDGSEAIIPSSQVFGQDYDVQKSEAWWISEWILRKKDLQYSGKKVAWFDENGKMLPTYTSENHYPKAMEAKDNNEIDELKR